MTWYSKKIGIHICFVRKFKAQIYAMKSSLDRFYRFRKSKGVKTYAGFLVQHKTTQQFDQTVTRILHISGQIPPGLVLDLATQCTYLTIRPQLLNLHFISRMNCFSVFIKLAHTVFSELLHKVKHSHDVWVKCIYTYKYKYISRKQIPEIGQVWWAPYFMGKYIYTHLR